jgi:phosphatidylglycerophosphatase A
MVRPTPRLDQMHRLVGSVFGTGFILEKVLGSHTGSGTVGAIVALPPAIVVGEWLGWQGQVVAAMVVVIISVWTTSRLVDEAGDAGWIVIDEAAGVFVAVVGLPLWPEAVFAWVVFRAADIFKGAAPGVGLAERLHGGVGVTADDVVAGLYGLAAGHLLGALL